MSLRMTNQPYSCAHRALQKSCVLYLHNEVQWYRNVSYLYALYWHQHASRGGYLNL